MPLPETQTQPDPVVQAAMQQIALACQTKPLPSLRFMPEVAETAAPPRDEQLRGALSMIVACAEIRFDFLAGKYIGTCEGMTASGRSWGEVAEALAEGPVTRELRRLQQQHWRQQQHRERS